MKPGPTLRLIPLALLALSASAAAVHGATRWTDRLTALFLGASHVATAPPDGGAASPPSLAEDPRQPSDDSPQRFIERAFDTVTVASREADPTLRDASLNGLLDFDQLTRRAFGAPCPPSIPSCEDLWAKLDDAQRAEVRLLFAELVRVKYRRYLHSAPDYGVRVRGTVDSDGDARVRTEATSAIHPDDLAIRMDYVVERTAEGYRVVDLIVEGSSLSKNYYEHFRKKMSNPREGYTAIVEKLRAQIAKNS